LASPTLQLVPRIVGNREAAESQVILSQPLDVFGQRRAQAGVARAELRRAEAQSTLAERALVVGVKNAAANLFAAQEAESLGSVQVEVAQLFRDAAARRAELGDVPPVQVQRAELELLRVQNELTNAQAERLARRAALNQLVGQTPETPLRVALPAVSGLTDLLRVRPGPLRSGATGGAVPLTGATTGVGEGAAPGAAGIEGGAMGGIPAVPPIVGEAPGNGTRAADAAPSIGSGAPILGSSAQVGSNLVGLRGQVLPSALVNRPDVVSAQATLEARQAQVQVLQRSRRPAIELQARRNAFFGESGSTAIRAVVTLPLFDFGAIKRERRALEAEVGAQQATIDLLRSQVATQVEQALIRLEQQQQTVSRYRAGIVPQTLDLLRKTQIGYAQGASTYLEVLEAQRTLRQVQTEYLQALVGTRTQEAALEGALGSAPTAELLGSLTNPSGPVAPPGTAAPGTVPPDTIPTLPQEPLSPPSSTVPATPTTLPGGSNQ
jgi:outer membrane protein TolC